MSSKNKSQLRTENSNNFPNNNSQFITPEKLRDFNNDVIDSMVVNQDTGSYLLTSSFDTGSRDLTFTRVDGTIYSNNIPGGGGGGSTDTGSLLVTASIIASSILRFLINSIAFLKDPTPGRTRIDDFNISSGSETISTSAPRYLNALTTEKIFPIP
mgnify:CR=1 FL=1